MIDQLPDQVGLVSCSRGNQRIPLVHVDVRPRVEEHHRDFGAPVLARHAQRSILLDVNVGARLQELLEQDDRRFLVHADQVQDGSLLVVDVDSSSEEDVHNRKVRIGQLFQQRSTRNHVSSKELLHRRRCIARHGIGDGPQGQLLVGGLVVPQEGPDLGDQGIGLGVRVDARVQEPPQDPVSLHWRRNPAGPDVEVAQHGWRHPLEQLGSLQVGLGCGAKEPADSSDFVDFMESLRETDCQNFRMENLDSPAVDLCHCQIESD